MRIARFGVGWLAARNTSEAAAIVGPLGAVGHIPWRDACSALALHGWAGSVRMLDLLLVMATIGCFAAAFAYARACERV